MTQSPRVNNISVVYQNLSITSDKEYDNRFESIIKAFQPKTLFGIGEIRYRKGK